MKYKGESSKQGDKTEETVPRNTIMNNNVIMEQQYQEALIDVMESIMVNVADYQKLEIIRFLLNKFPDRVCWNSLGSLLLAPRQAPSSLYTCSDGLYICLKFTFHAIPSKYFTLH